MILSTYLPDNIVLTLIQQRKGIEIRQKNISSGRHYSIILILFLLDG